jgi:hypothetical protein
LWGLTFDKSGGAKGEQRQVAIALEPGSVEKVKCGSSDTEGSDIAKRGA